jgi:hypothetical protein
MITLSRKIRELEDGLYSPVHLPKTSVQLTKIQQLYQHITYVTVEHNTIKTYVPLQYIREETATLESYRATKNEPMHIIWCTALDGDLRTIQFTKGYFTLLIDRGLVYTDPQSVRNQAVTW